VNKLGSCMSRSYSLTRAAINSLSRRFAMTCDRYKARRKFAAVVRFERLGQLEENHLSHLGRHD